MTFYLYTQRQANSFTFFSFFLPSTTKVILFINNCLGNERARQEAWVARAGLETTITCLAEMEMHGGGGDDEDGGDGGGASASITHEPESSIIMMRRPVKVNENTTKVPYLHPALHPVVVHGGNLRTFLHLPSGEIRSSSSSSSSALTRPLTRRTTETRGGGRGCRLPSRPCHHPPLAPSQPPRYRWLYYLRFSSFALKETHFGRLWL